MKEFIDKLIEELEGVKSIVNSPADIVWNNAVKMCIYKANQLAEEYKGGWIKDRNPTEEECKNNRFWITDSDRWSYEADFDLECERWRDLETGGFINVVAWHILPLPAPYTEGE